MIPGCLVTEHLLGQPYLMGIVSKLLVLIQNGKRMVQEGNFDSFSINCWFITGAFPEVKYGSNAISNAQPLHSGPTHNDCNLHGRSKFPPKPPLKSKFLTCPWVPCVRDYHACIYGNPSHSHTHHSSSIPYITSHQTYHHLIHQLIPIISTCMNAYA